MKVVLTQVKFIVGCCVDDECHIHGGVAYATRRWTSWRAAGRRAGAAGHPCRCPRVVLPRPGRAGAAVVPGRHPDEPTRHTTASARSANEATALLKMTFKALRNVSLDPWRIGKIVAAALVLLHFDHARTA